MTIRSPRNQTLKDIRRLRRSKGAHALLEGPHLLEEALRAGLNLSSVLVTPEFQGSEEGIALCDRLPRPPLLVEASLLESMTDADAPRGVLTVIDLPRRGVDALPASGSCTLFVEGMQDPGNLGALARVAEAAGASGLALSAGTVSANHPRALRASAGSLLRLPVAVNVTLEAVLHHLETAGSVRAAALVAHSGEDLFEIQLKGRILLLLGAEGPGLSAEARSRAEIRVTIPLTSPVESLNVTTAAAVALFELRRQRRHVLKLGLL